MPRLKALRSPFFRRLFASYAALVVATAAVVGFLVHREMKRALLADIERSLRDKAVLIEPFAATAFASADPATQEEAIRLGTATETRITLIHPDGKVLADSAEDPAQMENHRGRPEVLAALTFGSGLQRRHSATVGYEMLYAARAIRANGGVLGVVRVAIPLRDVDERLASMRRTIYAGAAVASLFALFAGILVARRMTSPLVAMTAVAEGMRHGRYESRVPPLGRDEVGLLGDALNRLGEEITRQLAAISGDRAQLEAILTGMSEGVLAVDEEDRVLFCNRAACDLLRSESLCDPGRRLWEVARLPALAELLRETRESGTLARREIVVRDAPRETVLDLRATPFEGGGRRGVVVVVQDVSDLRRLERVRRDFVANVSHEIKTPLTSIQGYVETLLSGALDDPENNLRFLRKIDDHVRRLHHLVRDLLSLARIESEEAAASVAPVDWRPVVEDALRRHEAALDEKGLRFSVEGEGSPVVVLGDEDAMTQVLDNLLDNAIQYTPTAGRVTVRLREEGTLCRLEVEDTGIGIPEGDLDRVFERFYRVDKARSHALGGTGLGLSIVKHLVQAMRGEVRVESAVGKGSRFTVLLPLARPRGALREPVPTPTP